MAIERLFTEQDIQALLDNNSAPPFGRRNAALIMGGVYWGLSPYELSMLSNEEVISENGEFFKVWVIPKHASYNHEPRECYTEDHVLAFFEEYANWKIEQNLGVSNIAAFRGLSPKGKFFLNDKGGKYKLSLRKKDSDDLQPRAMSDQLKRMIKKAGLHGATPSSFRDSQIRELYNNGCGWKDLMTVTGIKQKRTLERRIRPEELELDKVFRSIYSRVKNPF